MLDYVSVFFCIFCIVVFAFVLQLFCSCMFFALWFWICCIFSGVLSYDVLSAFCLKPLWFNVFFHHHSSMLLCSAMFGSLITLVCDIACEALSHGQFGFWPFRKASVHPGHSSRQYRQPESPPLQPRIFPSAEQGLGRRTVWAIPLLPTLKKCLVKNYWNNHCYS